MNPNLEVIKRLDVDSENNEGIFLVRDNSNGNLLIEKRFKLYDIWNGAAQLEIDILRQLRGHPNISTIKGYHLKDGDVNETKGSVWLEYCNQGTLEDSIMQHGEENLLIPERSVWYVFGQLAEAVRVCQQGFRDAPPPNWEPVIRNGWHNWDTIFHLDINPSNIFLDDAPLAPFPRVVLGDFGCSTTLSTQLKNAQILARNLEANVPAPFHCEWQNTEYSPPECPTFDHRSDIYQVGLVIYCMVIGDTLIPPDTDVMGELWKVGHDKYSGDLLRLVSSCLKTNPADRPDITQLVQMIASHEPRV